MTNQIYLRCLSTFRDQARMGFMANADARQPVATKAALGSERVWRKNKRRSGRAIQFCGETKPGCRNGAASWAERSGVLFGRAGCFGASQSFNLRHKPVG